jgi:hypothetical protein
MEKAMTKLNVLFLELEPIITNPTLKNFLLEIIAEIDDLKNARNTMASPSLESEWLMAEEFVKKYPLFHADQLGTLRNNCPDPNQKFYKAVAYEYAYNPRETFRYIMRLPSGKVKTKNRLIRNNFFGVNMED